MVLFDRGELTIFVPREHLRETVKAFRDDAHLRFEICVSVSGVHYPQQTGAELHVVYHLLSITHNRRVRLEAAVGEELPMQRQHGGRLHLLQHRRLLERDQPDPRRPPQPLGA